MGHTCLVAGRSGETLSAIAREAVTRGRTVLLARSAQADASAIPEEVQTASWNRRSALSARTLVLHAQNLFGSVDEAIVFFSPIRETVPFHESSIVSIENRTDAEVKGFLFLLREIASAFQKQSAGRLTIAVNDLDRETRSPLEAMSIASFVAAAESLFRYYDGEQISVRLAALRPDSEPEGFPGHVLELADATDPRKVRGWNSYPQRSGLFGRSQRASFIDQRSPID